MTSALPPDLDLWILAGQSNMEGVGELTAALPPDGRIWSFTSAGAWATAQEPLHRFWESFTPVHQALCRGGLPAERKHLSDAELAALSARERLYGAGLGPAFARAWNEATGKAVGLLPCAHGGTSMEQWSPALRDQGGASLYGALCLRVARCGRRPRGVLWYQGESEGWNPAAAATYGARLAELIASLRADLGQPELPVLVVQIGRTTLDSPRAAAWNLVQQAQADLDVPDTAVTSAIDLPLIDCIHIDAGGLQRLGRRLARLALGHPAPRIVAARRGSEPPDRGVVHLTCAGVTGGWQPEQHIAGFEVLDAAGAPHPSNHVINVFRGADPTALTVRLNLPLAADQRLVYGHGLRPYCNAVDGADMSLCAGEVRGIV